MTTEKKKPEQKDNKEDDIEHLAEVDAKKRSPSGWEKAGQGHLPAKDSLEGVW